MSGAVEVFAGKDPVLLSAAVRTAITEALGDESPDFALAELTEPDYLAGDTYSIAALVDAAQTPPMLSGRRVVVGHHLARFSTGDSVTPLVAYLADPLPTTHLVLVWDRGPANSRSTTTIPKALKEMLATLGVSPVKTDVSNKEASSYIEDRLRELDVRVDASARRLLIETLGDGVNRMGGIARALQGAYGSERVLSADEVHPYIGEAGDVPPWDLTDAMAAGDVPLALATCRRMVRGGERHPLAILSTLATHYGRMASLDGAPVGGEKDAAAYLGVRGSTYPVKKAMQQARRMGNDRVKRAWSLLAQADLDLRGGTGVAPEQVLEVLVARLASLSR